LSDTATVTVNCTAVPNNGPTAADDAATTDEDNAITISVLDNDGDLDGDSLTVIAVGAASNGSVTYDGATVVYTPDANFAGSDSFTYTVNDGEMSDTATVVVTVNPVNDTPLAADDDAATNEDTALTISVLDNDGDLDGDTLTIVNVSAASNGVLTRDGESIVYTPDADFVGADSFTYTVNDGKTSDTATVMISVHPVNDAPLADDDSASTDEDNAITISVLDNDSDLEGDSLTVIAVGAAGNGSVTFDGATVVYTPDANFNGDDSFTYTVNDGDLSATATVVVTVNPVNDTPLAADDTVAADENGDVTINVFENDSDLDGNTLTIVSVSAASNGTVTHDGASIVYTPNAGFVGADSFTYTVSDGVLSDTATVTVVVQAATTPALVDNAIYLPLILMVGQ